MRSRQLRLCALTISLRGALHGLYQLPWDNPLKIAYKALSNVLCDFGTGKSTIRHHVLICYPL